MGNSHAFPVRCCSLSMNTRETNEKKERKKKKEKRMIEKEGWKISRAEWLVKLLVIYMNSQDSYVWKNEEATIRCLKILFDEILFLAADRRLFNQSCSTFEKKKKKRKKISARSCVYHDEPQMPATNSRQTHCEERRTFWQFCMHHFEKN